MVHEGEKHGDGVSLPEDIVLDVLTRVPANDLCRFRCVCKAWHAVMSDPVFIAAQRSRAGPHLVGVFYMTRPPEVRVMDMDGNVVRVFKVQILSKNNGNDALGILQPAVAGHLICVNDAMIIDLAAGRACTVGMDTPFDMLSFGRAASSGAFKFISLELEEDFPSQICKVPTIVEGSREQLTWRQRSAPPFLISCQSEHRATVNGVMYFMAGLNVDDDGAPNSDSDRISAFDLENEEWMMTNGPVLEMHDETRYAYVTLSEYNGTLAVVQCIRSHGHYYANIWSLIDFKKSVWVKDYTIEMLETWVLTKVLGALDYGRTILRVSRQLEGNNIGYHYRNVLVFYNPSIETFTESMDKVTMGCSDILVLYNGSLLSWPIAGETMFACLGQFGVRGMTNGPASLR